MAAAAQVLEAWSEVFSSPVITELTPGRVWEVAAERGDRYVLKKVSTFGAPDPVRRFTGEARILTYLLQRGVPVAVPVLSDDGRACTTASAVTCNVSAARDAPGNGAGQYTQGMPYFAFAVTVMVPLVIAGGEGVDDCVAPLAPAV